MTDNTQSVETVDTQLTENTRVSNNILAPLYSLGLCQGYMNDDINRVKIVAFIETKDNKVHALDMDSQRDTGTFEVQMTIINDLDKGRGVIDAFNATLNDSLRALADVE